MSAGATSARIGRVSNHPNRSKKNPSPARNPTPAEIRAAREAAGLTQLQAAELLFSHVNTWQQWEADPKDPAHRRMHPKDWLLFKHLAGLEQIPFTPATPKK